MSSHISRQEKQYASMKAKVHLTKNCSSDAYTFISGWFCNNDLSCNYKLSGQVTIFTVQKCSISRPREYIQS